MEKLARYPQPTTTPETELFLELAELVSTTTRVGPALALACERLATVLDCTRVSVFLAHDGRPVPRMSRFASGIVQPEQWEQFRATAAALRPPPVIEEVLATGEPIVCTEYADEWWSEYFQVSSLMAVPIGNASHPLGVLVADSQVPTDFGPEQVRLAIALGVQLGGIVALAQHIEAQQTRLAIAEARRQLHESGLRATTMLSVAETLAKVAAESLGYDRALSIAMDADGTITDVASLGVSEAVLEKLQGVFVGSPLVDSPIGSLFERSREPITIEQFVIEQRGSRDALDPLGIENGWCIPIICSQNRVGGIVIAGQSSTKGSHSADHRELISFLCQESTLVAENALLRDRDHYQATHDSLTNLANRTAFENCFALGLEIAKQNATPLAVLLLDLNRFKDVNDTLGHHMGDCLLQNVAQRILDVTRHADIVARFGGDEFVILLSASADPKGAMAVATRLVNALEQPLLVADRSIWIGASVGIACYPEHGSDAQTLLHRADLAMYEAKRTTMGAVAYDASTDRAQSQVPGLLLELPRAIQQDELVLFYQPKLDMRTQTVIGVEALVRWEHPTLGLLGPEQFVPLAEATGIIRQLTSWVITTALKQAADWQNTGHKLGIAVNISARDLADATLPERVSAALSIAGVPAHQLTLELTESAIMADEVKGKEILERLRQLGVRLSLDDFGTGYSALAYLEDLPLDEVKIDRSFLSEDREAGSLVIHSIATMGHHLGLRIVAEGIESRASYDRAAEISCDELQGFALSPPVGIAEFNQWLSSWDPALLSRNCPDHAQGDES